MSAHRHGLGHDLRRLVELGVTRRRMFGIFAGAAALPLVGAACTTDGAGADAVDATSGTDGAPGACSTIPAETAGPYPGDGTNGPNALAVSGIVRRDLRSSFGGPTGTAAGVPLTITLALVDASNGCAPLVGHAVYLWHCDRDGNYSMYSAAVQGENYLRGVQVTDAAGQVTFTSIFPGCYSGRWPHIHFEVYSTVAAATAGGNAIATSQLALPKATCDVVYATGGYASSATNLGQISLATDNVFRDDQAANQLATMSGSVAAGYTAMLTVGTSG
ncbi:MAG TPA: intradiol ring-cleavage dioxygenase [Kofleriaceae bacterium]|nr:intradiol ring-cleavage dioxygenase [Kofleriaceae bacterium]